MAILTRSSINEPMRIHIGPPRGADLRPPFLETGSEEALGSGGSSEASVSQVGHVLKTDSGR